MEVAVEEYHEARNILEKLIEINPKKPIVHYYLALTYNILGEFDNAYEEFKRINELTQVATTELQEIYSIPESKCILANKVDDAFSKEIIIII